ncbi:MAG: MBL fold metallo-hydrolase [Polyangiaceae bacterium]|nr:MBL fold metallo-hydrolase [Polyangiaceae bacterium]
MGTTNAQSGTRIDEVVAGIYRINTPIEGPTMPGGFSFNQYLVVDDEPFLMHTGPRRMFALVREAIETVMPVAKLRWIGVSHYEADECGSLNEFLAVAPNARSVSGAVAAMVSLSDVADREPHALPDEGELVLGNKRLMWLDTPHVPHAWDCGFFFEKETRTLLCGDLFTQPGAKTPALTEGDVLGPSEAFRHAFDYYSHTKLAKRHIERLAKLAPTTLACMHGSAWRGDGASLLRELGVALDKD